jgi:hypothetical protein
VDLLTDDAAKAFLFGVTSGREVNTVTIDGTPCGHLVFEQPPGIELELGVEKYGRAPPRRLVVTYRDLPGSRTSSVTGRLKLLSPSRRSGVHLPSRQRVPCRSS